MTLREVSSNIISLVENVSGGPVVVSEEASLKTLAASRDARRRPYKGHLVPPQRPTRCVDQGLAE
jgi:hypothetical protein